MNGTCPPVKMIMEKVKNDIGDDDLNKMQRWKKREG
jgi:sulfur relay (sulfurtransferase) DsrC/TusE family protein